MKKLFAVAAIAVTLTLAGCSAAPAGNDTARAASTTSSHSGDTAQSLAPDQELKAQSVSEWEIARPAAPIQTSTKLSNTQVNNFVIAYCINVNAHGWAWTLKEFNEVVSYDDISATQAELIEALASQNC